MASLQWSALESMASLQWSVLEPMASLQWSALEPMASLQWSALESMTSLQWSALEPMASLQWSALEPMASLQWSAREPTAVVCPWTHDFTAVVCPRTHGFTAVICPRTHGFLSLFRCCAMTLWSSWRRWIRTYLTWMPSSRSWSRPVLTRRIWRTPPVVSSSRTTQVLPPRAPLSRHVTGNGRPPGKDSQLSYFSITASECWHSSLWMKLLKL